MTIGEGLNEFSKLILDKFGAERLKFLYCDANDDCGFIRYDSDLRLTPEGEDWVQERSVEAISKNKEISDMYSGNKIYFIPFQNIQESSFALILSNPDKIESEIRTEGRQELILFLHGLAGMLNQTDLVKLPVHSDRARLRAENIELQIQTQTLSEVKDQLESLFEHAPFPYFVLTKEGYIVRFNEKARSWLLNIGQHPDLNGNFKDIVWKQDSEKFTQALERLKLTFKPVIELTLRLQINGSIHTTKANLQSSLAKQSGWFAYLSLSDITTEQQQYSERINELIQEISYNQVLLEEAGRVARLGVWEQYLGENKTVHLGKITRELHSLDKSTGANWKDLASIYKEEDGQKLLKALKKLRSEGKPFDLILRGAASYGTFYRRFVGRPDKKDGEISRIFGVVQDVTESEIIRLQLKSLAFVAETTDNVVIMMQPDGRTTWVNSAFERLTDFHTDFIYQKSPFRELAGPETNTDMLDAMENALANGNSLHGRIVLYYQKERPIWVDFQLNPIYDERQNIQGFYLFNKDITDQVENRALKKANGELDSFVYRVSHDLRAPVASSLGLIQLLENEELSVEASQLVNLQKKSLDRMDRFIKDILHFSRNARMEVTYEIIDIHHLVEQVFDKYRFTEEAQIVSLEYEIIGETKVFSNQMRLSVILDNLVSNSLRYHNRRALPTPFVKVVFSVQESHFSVKVQDNGVGIEHASQPKIFDMFYRAHDSNTGSGLGLYMVKEMMDILKGSIKVESEPGKGTSIQLLIPTQNL
jgi:PAS domain S-box-containing protein